MNSDGLHRGTLGFHGFGQLLRFKNCFFKGSDFFYGLNFQGYGYGCFIGFLVTVFSQGLDGTGFLKDLDCLAFPGYGFWSMVACFLAAFVIQRNILIPN